MIDFFSRTLIASLGPSRTYHYAQFICAGDFQSLKSFTHSSFIVVNSIGSLGEGNWLVIAYLIIQLFQRPFFNRRVVESAGESFIILNDSASDED